MAEGGMNEDVQISKDYRNKSRPCNGRIVSDTSQGLLRYNIERPLGRATLLVRDTKQAYQLCVMRKVKLDRIKTEHIQGMLKEITRWRQQLNHSGFIQITDLFQVGDYLYIVSEYCEGGALRNLISRAKKYDEILNEIEILDWFVQILQALQSLHQQDTYHGHLSCGNIYLKENCVKIGFSRDLKMILDKAERLEENTELVPRESTDSEKSVEFESNIEHFFYKSPEVCQQDKYTTKADVWASGCVLYELCSQKFAFNADNLQDLQALIANEPAPAISELFPEELRAICHRMLEKDSEKRPAIDNILQMPFIQAHVEDMTAEPVLWTIPGQGSYCRQSPDARQDVFDHSSSGEYSYGESDIEIELPDFEDDLEDEKL